MAWYWYLMLSTFIGGILGCYVMLRRITNDAKKAGNGSGMISGILYIFFLPVGLIAGGIVGLLLFLLIWLFVWIFQ